VAFSEIELKKIDKLVGGLCRSKTKPDIRDQLRFEYEIKNHNVYIWEVRPVFFDPTQETKHGVARFQFIRTRNRWKLYWMRADLKWHAYEPEPGQAMTDLKEQVAEVENDRYGAFFG
jgi:DUF3024 family protein